jgi:voltage-dependent potassium channel beta subunit
MHYRRLGRSGLKVSEISLGSWVTFGTQVDEQKAASLLKTAYERGINYFDNADIYADGQAEIIMGKAIQSLPRTELVLSSKVFWPTSPGPNARGLSRKHVMESVHASLKRMRVEYFDLYFCHRYDPETPIEEVVRTMNILIQQGKILYWGTSEWEASQVAQAFGIARQYDLIPPAMDQPQYNLLHRKRVEDTLMPLTRELGMGLTTFSPLAYGILTGKYNNGIPEGSRASLENYGWVRDRITPEKIERVKKLQVVAKDLGVSAGQLAIAWILRRGEISTVITGATRVEQLDENLASAEVVERLNEEVLARIDAAVEGFE